MNLWLILIVLSLLQGITEFLPVSSSGHLAVLGEIFHLPTETGLAFGIVLHAGSLLAIIAFYFKTLLGFFRKEQLPLLGMVILGTIPAGIAGILLKKSGLMEMLFGDMLSIGFAWLVTGAVLRLTGKEKLIRNSHTELRKITVKQALIVGFAQMFAILPGISRSGSTIAAGILAGLQFEAAATFSFLLALPAIGGATLLELKDLCETGFVLGGFSPWQLAAGFSLSAVTSFAALSFLVAIIRKRKLSAFSWYLSFAGLAVIIWQIIKLNGKA